MNPQFLLALERNEWFRAVPPDRRSRLLAAGRVLSFPAGKRIYSNGDAGNGLWAVLDGQVRLTGLPENGSEFLVRILKPGSWFGELSTLDDQPRPQEAVAFESSVLIQIDQVVFNRLASEEPLLFRDIALLVCINQRLALAFIAHSAAPVRARLATALLSAASASGTTRIKLRQSELAALVGISRQTLNKELKSFERANLVRINYAEVVLEDELGLRAIRDS